MGNGDGASPVPSDPHRITLDYSLLGRRDGRCILFLHGITGSRRYFLKKVRPLDEKYRLFLPDLPGFGDSPKPRTDYTLDLYRDTVRNTVIAAGLAGEPLHIVGHSLGALIALEYSVRHPENVDRMVLLGLPRFVDSHAAHDHFMQGSPNYRRLLNQHSLGLNLAQWRRSGIQMAVQYLFHFPLAVIKDSRKFTLNSLTSTLDHCLLNYRVDEILARLGEHPIRLIHGRRDQVAPFNNIAGLPERHPGMTLFEIGDSGHHIFLTHTRRCLALIEEHLAGDTAGHPSSPRPSHRRSRQPA